MATSTTPVEFSPLPTTREERGRQIAQLGRIRPLGAAYVVPSQSVRGGDAPPTCLVDLVEQTCTCPDYATRRMVCKHQEAVLFWLAWEGTVNEDTGQIEFPRSERKPKRKTYPRNWPAYNAAQIEEKARVEVLLKALCEGIEQPACKPGARGRGAYSRRDAIFGCVLLSAYATYAQIVENLPCDDDLYLATPTIRAEWDVAQRDYELVTVAGDPGSSRQRVQRKSQAHG